MTTTAIYDTETNGLLKPKLEKGVMTPPMDRMHTLTMILTDRASGLRRQISACDQPGYEKGTSGRGWERMPIADALMLLAEADVRVAFNGQDFDEGCPFRPGAIQIAYPWWKAKEGSALIDPLLLSRLLYPDIHKTGPNRHKLPGNMKRQHNLKSWGFRLGVHKGDYRGGWGSWNEDMQVYGEQDTLVLERVFLFLMAQKPTRASSAIEHSFAAIIRRQEDRGFGFDMDKALVLVAELTDRKLLLEGELIEAFGEWWAHGRTASAKASRPERYDPDDDEDAEDEEVQAERAREWKQRQKWGDVVIPAKDRAVKSLLGLPEVEYIRLSEATGKPLRPYQGPPKTWYSQGAPYTPIKRVQFNPTSRAHIRQRLVEKYGWEPSRFTKGGKNSPPVPVVDDDVMRGLPYPEAQRLADYYLISKRLGAVSEGKQAWIKNARETVDAGGHRTFRIHGRVNTNGAATARCTHMSPNMAQVPKNTAAFKLCPQYDEVQGYRCRELFIAQEPYQLEGMDGSSLELCMAGHYLSKFDGGAYSKIVTESDPHAWMRTEIIGEQIIGSGAAGRDNSKTAFYAGLYGAGDEKEGAIVLPTATVAEKRALGREIKRKVFDEWEAMRLLREAIEQTVHERGYLIGLDGRKLHVRKIHAALNTLLQSAGAIVMKQALIVLDANLQAAAGMLPGRDYEFVANIHDEAQAEVLPELAPTYRQYALQALPEAGRILQVKCPLTAAVSPKEGHGPARSWRETH